VQVRWRRIVLDEAHCIKDRACNTAKAVFALTSEYKWALSGTPLQVRKHVAKQALFACCVCYAPCRTKILLAWWCNLNV
jgi:DNA repair protein RAD16